MTASGQGLCLDLRYRSPGDISNFMDISVTSISDVDRPRPLNGLFKYPNEIIVQILAELDYRDLLALRLTSHGFHNLVHTHESALAQKRLDSLPYRHLLRTSLLSSANDLSQIVQLSLRQSVAAKLAGMMGERIASKLDSDIRLSAKMS